MVSMIAFVPGKYSKRRRAEPVIEDVRTFEIVKVIFAAARCCCCCGNDGRNWLDRVEHKFDAHTIQSAKAVVFVIHAMKWFIVVRLVCC